MDQESRYLHPSSAVSWKECPRKVWYEYHPPAETSAERDPFDALIAQRGLAHEEEVRRAIGAEELGIDARHTRELMAQGVPAIYQPVLRDDELKIDGRPDFLIRSPSGEYQAGDAKLALSLRNHKEIALQLAVYRKLLGGKEPAIAYLGRGNQALVGEEYAADAEKFLASLRAIVDGAEPPRTIYGETKCKHCEFEELCVPKFLAEDELTLVYGIDGRNAPGLAAQGITTVRRLAAAEPEQLADGPHFTGLERKRRAVLQARSFLTGEVFQLAPVKLPAGPLVHFDVESNSLGEHREVYLWGCLPPPYGKDSFEYTWSDGSAAQDRAAWEQFLQRIEEYRARMPGLRLVHYSAFESVRISEYADRYGMREHPTVAWLLGRGSPLVDLQDVVTDALVLPLTGYGLKAICKDTRLVNFQWELPQSGSEWSVVRYQAYLREPDTAARTAVKSEILSYNRDDVLATRALEEWLRTFPAR